eukprot:UN12781
MIILFLVRLYMKIFSIATWFKWFYFVQKPPRISNMRFSVSKIKLKLFRTVSYW